MASAAEVSPAKELEKQKHKKQKTDEVSPEKELEDAQIREGNDSLEDLVEDLQSRAYLGSHGGEWLVVTTPVSIQWIARNSIAKGECRRRLLKGQWW